MARLIALFLLLPATFALDRVAYYGMRSVLSLHLLRGLGASTADIGTLMSASFIAGAFTVFLGGLACLVLRPSIVMAAGAAIGVIAYGVLSLSSSVPVVWAAVLLLALGQGLLKPAVFAVAIVELPWPKEHLRSALVVLLYATTNAGALSGSSGSSFVATHSGEAVSFALSSGLALVSVVLALGVVAVDFVTRRPQPEPGPRPGAAVAGAGVLLFATLPYYAAMSLAGAYQFEVLRASGVATASYASVFSLNPLTVMLVSAPLFIGLIIVHLTKVRVSSLFGVGAGLTLFALAMTPLLLSSGPSNALLLVGSASVGMAVGEALVGPLMISRALGDIPPRFIGLAAAVVFAVSYGVGTLVDMLATAWSKGLPVLVALSAVACLITGLAVLALTPLMVRRLYTPPAAQPGTEPAT